MKDNRRFQSMKMAAGLIAMTVLCAVSCEKEPGGVSKSVRIRVESSETKGSAATTSSLNMENETFILDLIETNTKAIIKDCDGGEVLSREVTYSEEDSWSLAKYIYWEKQTMDAWARYPATINNGSMGLVTSISDGVASEYSTDANGNKVTINADRTAMVFNFLTYHSDSNDDAEKQEDLLFAHSYSRTYEDLNGVIPIHFYHALAAVYFKVGGTSDGGYEVGENVRIDNITIKNVKRAGTCTFTPSKVKTDNPDNRNMSTSVFDGMFSWDTSTDGTLDRSIGNYTQSFAQTATTGTILGPGNSFGNGKTFFLIPQEMAENARLSVTWSKKINGNWVSQDTRDASIYSYTDKDGNTKPVTWKAGYKYLYTIKLAVKGNELNVNLDVEDWDYTDTEISFDSGVAVSENGRLSITGGLDNYNETTGVHSIVMGTDPVRCAFNLSAPKGGKWYVSLTDSHNFSLSSDGSTKEGESLSGSIDDGEAEFYVIPDSTDGSKDHKTTLKISAQRADGTTISANDELGTANWEIVIPQTEI